MCHHNKFASSRTRTHELGPAEAYASPAMPRSVLDFPEPEGVDDTPREQDSDGHKGEQAFRAQCQVEPDWIEESRGMSAAYAFHENGERHGQETDGGVAQSGHSNYRSPRSNPLQLREVQSSNPLQLREVQSSNPLQVQKLGSGPFVSIRPRTAELYLRARLQEGDRWDKKDEPCRLQCG
jgi:hypothetical protein